MKTRVTLIYAGITQCGFNARLDDDEGSYIHHGLCSISASARRAGFRVDLIDLRRISGWEHFSQKVRESSADVFGMTMNSIDYNNVVKCAMIVRKHSPGSRTVVGGIHPTIMTEEVKDSGVFDHIVTGEGEITFVELLRAVEEGRQFPDVARGTPPDVDDLPFADRAIFEAPEEPRMPGLESPFVTMIAGRGCIYNCAFCQPAERMVFGNKVRRRSVENVIRELAGLKQRCSFKSLMIHDDCLTEDEEWVKEFCAAYRGKGFGAPFICQSRSDFVCRNPGLVREMKEAGLTALIIGFESGSQRVLDFLHKGTTVGQNYEAARICREAGIAVWANYMLGVPGETKEETMATVRMIREINPHHASPSFFTPHPGSKLYEYCIKNNLSLIKTHEDYRRSPRGTKIRGIDYAFLDRALQMSLGNIPVPRGPAEETAAGVSGQKSPFITFAGKLLKVLCAYSVALFSLFAAGVTMAATDILVFLAGLLSPRVSRSALLPSVPADTGRSTRLSFIVLNWNGIDFLEECLNSIKAQTISGFEMILVDNGSSDGSVSFVRTRFPDVKLIELGRNLGVSAGFNAGIRNSSGDLIAMINNDVVLEKEWAASMLGAISRHGSVWFAASKLKLYHNRTRLHSAGDVYGIDCHGYNLGHRDLDSSGYCLEKEVFGACAGAAVYRKDLFAAIGEFDEDFFMTFEDVDLSFRIQSAGGRCIYAPAAVACHHGTATIGIMSRANTYYTMRNGLNVIVKNVPSAVLLRHCWTILKNRLSRAREFAIFGSFSGCIKGMLSSVACMPRMLAKRFRIQRQRKLTVREIDSKLHRDVRRVSLLHLLLP